MNQNTATTQQLLNMTDQVTPNGSLKYDQTGSSSFTGADGKTYTVPKFTATQTLSPAQQQLLDLTNRPRPILARSASTRARRSALLGTNLNLNTATEGKIDALGAAARSAIRPHEDALRTRLSPTRASSRDRGLEREMTQFGQNKTTPTTSSI
jgi:hypothetical protein